MLRSPCMSRINTGLMNNSETNKNGPTHILTVGQLGKRRGACSWVADT